VEVPAVDRKESSASSKLLNSVRACRILPALIVQHCFHRAGYNSVLRVIVLEESQKSINNAGFQSRSTFLLGKVSNIDLQICKHGRCKIWRALPADFAHTKNMGKMLNCSPFAVYAAGPGRLATNLD
jgi:hypothetical protein